MQEHDFLHDFGRVLHALKEYWHLVVAVAATLWGMLLMARRHLTLGFATEKELEDCHNRLICRINENRDRNTEEHSEIKDLIIRSLSND